MALNIGFIAGSGLAAAGRPAAARYAEQLADRLYRAFGEAANCFRFFPESFTPSACRSELVRLAEEGRIQLLVVTDPFDAIVQDRLPSCVPDDVRLAVYVHDLLPLRAGLRAKIGAGRAADGYDRLLDLLRRADLVWTSHEAARLEAALYAGVPPSRVHVIRAGLSPAFGMSGPAGRSRLQLRRGIAGRYLLASGDMPYRSGLAEATAVFAEVRRRCGGDLQLVWIDLEADESRRCLRLARRLGADGLVPLEGPVPDDELAALYGGAELLLHPAQYEGFAFAPLLAAVCGTPVLASDNGTLRELCGDAAVYADPSDIRAMADAAARMLESPADRLSDAGRKLVRRYSWAHVIREAAQSAGRLTYSMTLQPSRYRQTAAAGEAALFSFSPGVLPRGAVLTEAVLKLPAAAGAEVRLHGVESGWTCGTHDTPLPRPIGRKPLFASAASSGGGADGRQETEWRCTALVARWLADPASNRGLLATGLRRDQAPALVLRYGCLPGPSAP